MEYYFGLERGNFSTAQMYCSNLNSHLVIIANQSIQDFVESKIKKIAGKNKSKILAFNNI